MTKYPKPKAHLTKGGPLINIIEQYEQMPQPHGPPDKWSQISDKYN